MILILTASGAPVDRVTETGALTAAHLAIIAAFAVLVLLGILWGARQKRARAAGEAEEESRNDALRAHPPTPAPLDDASAGRQVADTPASPAPEPLAEPAGRPSVDLAPDQPAAAPPASRAATRTHYRLIDVKGLGPKAVPLLEALDVTDLAGLAALSDARAAEIDRQLGALSGRLTRDRWVEQARLLDAGQVTEFEAAFGKL